MIRTFVNEATLYCNNVITSGKFVVLIVDRIGFACDGRRGRLFVRRSDELNEGTSDQDATNELRNNYLLLPDCHIVPSRPVCPMKIAR